MRQKLIIKIAAVIFLISISTGCKKLVEIPEPIDSITTSEAYSSDATAISTVLAIYNYMSWNRNTPTYANSWITLNMGMYADELNQFGGAGYFEMNTLNAGDGDVGLFWSGLYFTAYMSNAAMEGLQASSAVSEPLKKQLTGEAKFIRALSHFYLVNLFGDVPLVTTSSFKTNATLPRSPSSQVYEQIINDLKDAQDLLSDQYAKTSGGFYTDNYIRIRPNKAAATALLARVYLYNEKWADAETAASKLISNTAVYGLEADLNNVFLAGTDQHLNTEAIWQLQAPNMGTYSTREGNRFIPSDNLTTPNYFLPPQLLSAFEAGDLRKQNWVGTTLPEINGVPTPYYYPYKFKVRSGAPDNITEYCMPLRLAEQYLIRAEARAQIGGDLNGAISDLNVIRNRAGLPSLANSLSQPQVLDAVARERRVELFAEWGHRWFDLKRTNQADNVIGALKPATWQPFARLFPIPLQELQKDPNLGQNPGYH